ncbi:MAG TPA: hypothetical protein VNJ02_01620, partial [Vicinamibacterales bacterium]|nr:hypothetical protein [Vicinamibacterales bacterium]
GCARVHAAHTYAHRYWTFLDTVEKQPRAVAPARGLSQGDIDAIYRRRHKRAGESAALFRRAAKMPVWSARRWRTVWDATKTAVNRGI